MHNLNQQQQQQPTTNRYAIVIDDHASRQPLATSTEPLGAEKFGQTLKKAAADRGRKQERNCPIQLPYLPHYLHSSKGSTTWKEVGTRKFGSIAMAKFLSEATNWIKRSISDAEDVQEDNSNGSGIRKQAST